MVSENTACLYCDVAEIHVRLRFNRKTSFRRITQRIVTSTWLGQFSLVPQYLFQLIRDILPGSVRACEGLYVYLRRAAVVRHCTAKGHFPSSYTGRVASSSQVQRGVRVGGSASICRERPGAKWKAWSSAALNIPANYNDIRIVRDGCGRLTPDGDTVADDIQTSIRRVRLPDAVTSPRCFPKPVRGISVSATHRVLPVPQDTRTIARRRI